MQSRGPDGAASQDFGYACLGVTRLAITDLANGMQPLHSLDGAISVVFNGAIYNHQDLRGHLAERFRTGNDGEVIHSLYRRYGLAFADHLRGMYAIVLLDHRRERLVLARDPMGIKPLFWAKQKNRLIIASTIDAFPPEVSRMIREVPAGKVWDISGKERTIRPLSPPTTPFLDTLRSAIREQIPGEVQWATLLSGGLDSALITQLAVEVSGTRVRAYTLGAGEDSPDVVHAKAFSRVANVDLEIIQFTEQDLEHSIDVAIRYCATYDPGIIQNAAATYLTAVKAAAGGCKVVLTGEGADELFGGYDEHVDVPIKSLNSTLLDWQRNLPTSECLRLDRGCMAASVEARVPFLSEAVVALARSIPASEKIRLQDGYMIRKHFLRKAALEVLPEAIAMRQKEPFFRGARIGQRIHDIAQRKYAITSLPDYRRRFPGFPLTDIKEVYFFEIWRRYYPDLASSWEEMRERGLARLM